MQNIRVLLAAPLLAITISGCATYHIDPKAGAQTLASAAPCCSSLTDIPSVPFDEVNGTVVNIDATKPAFEFSTGKSFVLAVALPPNRSWNKLTINSYYTSLYIPSASFFYPTIAVLDSNKRLVRTLPDTIFRFVTETWGEPPRLTASVELFPNPVSERYVVVYTTAEAINSSRSYDRRTSMVLPAGAAFISIPSSQRTTTPGSSVGGVKLIAQEK